MTRKDFLSQAWMFLCEVSQLELTTIIFPTVMQYFSVLKNNVFYIIYFFH